MGKGFAKTTVKNSAKYEMILKNAAALKKKPFVKVGILEGKAEKPKQVTKGTEETEPENSKLSLVEVATFHEFGTVNIPQRSFLRATIDANKASLQDKTSILFKKISSGEMDASKALGILGLEIKKLVQQRIRQGIDPKLDEKTIKQKGSSKPLIDTGQMINSIQHKVEDKGG